MGADEVVHLGGVLVVGPQQTLSEHIHGVLFVALVVVVQRLLQGDVTKGLRKCQQKCIFACFTAGQNIFHNVPLTAAKPSLLREG